MPDFRPLAGLAFLRVNSRDSSYDPVDNFLPFVAHALAALPPNQPIAFDELRDAVEVDFGIRIPLHALNTIIQRPRNGARVVRRTNRVFYAEPNALVDADLSAGRADALRTYELLLDRLRAFGAARYRVVWDRDAADQALLAFLDERTTQILGAVLDRTLPAPVQVVRGGQYVVAGFVNDAVSNDPEAFGLVLAVVKGAFIAQALLTPNLAEYARRFRDVTFYFDSPVLFRALGLSGPGLMAASSELFELLYAEHARLACFRHTLEEVLGVLDAARHQLQRGDVAGAFGEVMHFMVDSGWNALDVEELRLNIEERLKAMHVHVVERPALVADYVIDERALAERLDNAVGALGYWNPQARDRDVQSIAAVHQLRRGTIPVLLEESTAVFVTANAAVARASAEYFYADLAGSQSPGAAVPLCMLDWMLTTLVWIKAPHAAPDLPRSRLIADCLVIAQPSDAIWRRYADEISGLAERRDITGAQYGLLRYSQAARRALADLTMGGTEDFTAATAREVLRIAEESVRAQERSLREEAEGRAREADARAAAADTRAEAATARLLRLDSRARLRAIRVARVAGRAVWVLLMASLAIGAYTVFPSDLRVVGSAPTSVIFGIVFVVASVFSLTSVWPVRVIVESVERAAEPRALSVLRAAAGLDRPHESD